MAKAKTDPKDRLLDAILMHVPFDGWSDAALRDAARDIGMELTEARALCPRGAMDLAVAYHRRGDQAMIAAMSKTDLSDMRYRDKVATALRLRVDALVDREVVRRASALFALPHNAPEGARLVWETADHIWTALGDTSKDANWYTKRATLSAVWASVVLFWLGDDSPDAAETSAFIDRRIDDVMSIEKVKARFRENPITKPFADFQKSLMSRVRAPDPDRMSGLPGSWSGPR